MLPLALVGALVPIGATFLLLQATRWDRHSEPAPLVLTIALAVGVGLGLSSCAFFLALAIAGGARPAAMLIDALFAVGAVAVAWRRGVLRSGAASGQPAPATGRNRAIAAAVLLAAVAAVAAFALNTIGNPHGEWDAWAIWNLRARWLFRAGPAWHSAFTEDAIHGDYPLLLPAAVARLWAYAGADLPAIPGALAAAYAGALALLLYGSLTALRGLATGLLATLCLLGTPVFLRTVAWQYADIPLAFAMLASLALLPPAITIRPAVPARLPGRASRPGWRRGRRTKACCSSSASPRCAAGWPWPAASPCGPPSGSSSACCPAPPRSSPSRPPWRRRPTNLPAAR
jgi:hypothetical protein